jgi:transcription antitermination factor NusG
MSPENGGSLLISSSQEKQNCEPRQDLQWFAVQVYCRSEVVTSQLLQEKGYRVFVPLYLRRHTTGARVELRQFPLFSGYAFCQFDPLVRLPVLTTPGVIRIVGVGKVPVPIDDSEIYSLQLITKAGMALRPCDYLRIGNRVCVENGPLKGVEGILVKKKDEQRLVVSLTLLQRSVAVEFKYEDISLTESCGSDRIVHLTNRSIHERLREGFKTQQAKSA